MFSVTTFFSKVGSALHNFFTNNSGAIQSGLSAAMTAASVAGSVAAIMEPAGANGGPPPVVAEIAKVQDGLNLVSKAVTTASTATDLSGHAAALSGLVTGLVSSGDIGIKNAALQTAITTAISRVGNVVNSLGAAAVTPAA